MLLRRGHHLDDVAVAQLVLERHDRAVHARARAVVADLGVDRVGEVDGRGPARKHAHVPLRREHVHLVGEEIDLDRFEELGRVLHVLLELHELPEPAELLGVLRVDAARDLLFVLPVRGDAVLGDALHLVGADLNLDALAAGADDRRVERLVHVGLRQGNVILEPAGDGCPARVDDAERRVAIGHRLDDHAERDDVVDLLVVAVLRLHLAVDGVKVLRSALHVGGKPLLGEAARERLRHVGDVAVTLFLRLGDLRGEVLEALRVEVLERQVFELALEARDAEPVGERRVDVHRLARDPLLRLGVHEVERAHVVEAVAELHQEHADVARHRHDHLAEVLGLAVLLGGEVDLRELGDAVDQESDLVSEFVVDVVERAQGVLDDVVQEPGADARRVEPELGDDPGNGRGMDEVRVAALALLPLMGTQTVVVGPRHDFDVGGRLIASDPFD